MKTAVLIAVFALAAAGTAFGQAVIGPAVSVIADDIARRVPAGSRVAVINVASAHERLSDYIINGLIAGLADAGGVWVVPRGAVEAARPQFRLNHAVSPADLAEMGRLLGADAVISGAIARGADGTYRLNINIINTVGFFMPASYSADIRDDGNMRSLTAGFDAGAYWRLQQERAWRQDRSAVRSERFRMAALNTVFGFGDGLRADAPLLPLIHSVHLLLAAFVIFPVAFIVDGDLSTMLVHAYIYGGLVVVGWITPFYHVPGPGPRPSRTAYGGLPFDVALVSANQRDITGVTVSRTVRLDRLNSADRGRR